MPFAIIQHCTVKFLIVINTMAQIASSKLSASTQRSGGQTSSHQPGGGMHQAKLECTYKLDPDTRFPAERARQTIRDVLETELETQKYDPDKCPVLAKQLADAIKAKVKLSSPSRYKIISVVNIGSTEKGALSCVSQCVWNDKFDTYAECSFNNNSLYAVGMVFGIYQE